MSPLEDLKGIADKISEMTAARCINFDPKLLQPDENVPLDHMLVLQVISDVESKPPAFRGSMVAAWRSRIPVSIKDYGRNTFLATFGSQEEFLVLRSNRGGKYVQVKLSLPIAKPLPSTINFSLPTYKEHRLELRYERLSRFCTFCGRIGHDDNSCSLLEELDITLESPSTPTVIKPLLQRLREQRISEDIRAPSPSPLHETPLPSNFGHQPPPPHPSSGLLGAAPPITQTFNSDLMIPLVDKINSDPNITRENCNRSDFMHEIEASPKEDVGGKGKSTRGGLGWE